MAKYATIVVTIKRKGKPPRKVEVSGTTCKAIRKGMRRDNEVRAPGTKVKFGKCFYT
jgi:hypothetical protein